MAPALPPSDDPPSDDPAGDDPAGDGPAVELAIAEVARRVGVATSTLRAWERRYGLGPSGRTAGGHRRYTSENLAALQRMRRLASTGVSTSAAASLAHEPAPVEQPRTEAVETFDRTRQRFAAAVDSLDSARVTRVADAILARRGAVRAWTEVFAPHLQALGAHWEYTGTGVEREHLTTDAIRNALTRHTVRHSPRAPNVQILAAATPGEWHTLPLDALAAALADVGVGTCALGTLPPVALHAAIRDTTPDAVVLWARSAETSDPALLSGLVTRAPVVCAAGPGWPPRLAEGVLHLTDLTGAVRSLTSLTS
ncbi:MAG TPA: MerR family transcriptional regulator [Pseudonocardiaceae bacterium]|jgi:DNA-binding transcriptional MerR regulator|nr:MerR family transcriptional regulator [Pseudonocardiaceae bacterium]